MSEQYPLLCEDLSDEEKFSPRFHRRRPITRGRAKYHVRGAAAIMTRWPEHWTSILTYWWIGLGMIALITFVIYNSLFSIVLLQPTNARPIKYVDIKTSTHIIKPKSLPGVYMHVFVNNKEDEDYNKYIPYIEVFANKYNNFTYNLIVVSNDTNKETNNLMDESNNEIALNSLWTNDVNYGNLVSSNSNIHVKYVTLTNYLNDSPIKKYWNSLPHQFIPFLVRAISVWDRGGIAINPIILTPSSPHVSYVEKFVSIIKNFKKNSGMTITEQEHELAVRKKYKILPKVNNIRDVINVLEHGEGSDEPGEEILHAAETGNDFIVIDKENKLMSILRRDLDTEKQTKPLGTKIQHAGNFVESNNVANTTEALNQSKDSSKNEGKIDSPSKLLPIFLNYLFRDKETKSYNNTTHFIKKRRIPKITEIPEDVERNNLQTSSFLNNIRSTDNYYKPMIVSAKGIPHNDIKPTYQDAEKLFELTVDLKGNIIATQTPCHAFIGNVFTNAIHHDKSESLTDFIIQELSIFCKGLLASCMGIDVILV